MADQRSKIDRTKAKIRRVKASIRNDILIPRNIILLAIPIIVVAWFIGTITTLNRIWELQQQIDTRNLEKQRLALEIETISLENQYRASEEYQELTARRLQNKQLPGETLIYLPPNSELAKNKYADVVTAEEVVTEATNFEQWLTFLFGS